jgi:F0F1-type ATP synthase membrane subunit a
VLSLSIRLFANIMSGHALLEILNAITWQIIINGLGLFSIFLSIFPLGIIILIVILEFSIGFLQAYVFCISICIYINDVINLH